LSHDSPLLFAPNSEEETTKSGSECASTTETSKGHLSIEKVKLLCGRPNVVTLLSIRIISGLASGKNDNHFLQFIFFFFFFSLPCCQPNDVIDETALFHSSFIVIAKDIFGLDAQQNGYLMSLFGIVMALTQGGVIGALTSRFPEHIVMQVWISGVGMTT